MPQINLKAKLQAYSKVPFHNDLVREAPKDNGSYVRKNGEWIGLDTTFLQDSLEDFRNEVIKLEGVVTNINVDFSIEKDKLIFVSSSGLSKEIALPKTKIDNDTIGYNKEGQLYQLDVPDGTTIKVVNEIYSQNVEDIALRDKVSGQLRVEAIYVSDDEKVLSGQEIYNKLNRLEKNVSDLESYTQGTGGFLDPYNFGNLISYTNEEKNNLLFDYAYEQLHGGEVRVIPDQTKVKNTYDGHIWVYVQSTNIWIDEGADTIVTANNDGILGAVTGVRYNPNDINTKFKISIDADEKGNSLGTMTVNGLEEAFDSVVYQSDSDEEIGFNTYVRRTQTGQIKAADPIEDDDVMTQKSFNEWVNNMLISDEDMDDLWKE